MSDKNARNTKGTDEVPGAIVEEPAGKFVYTPIKDNPYQHVPLRNSTTGKNPVPMKSWQVYLHPAPAQPFALEIRTSLIRTFLIRTSLIRTSLTRT